MTCPGEDDTDFLVIDAGGNTVGRNYHEKATCRPVAVLRQTGNLPRRRDFAGYVGSSYEATFMALWLQYRAQWFDEPYGKALAAQQQPGTRVSGKALSGPKDIAMPAITIETDEQYERALERIAEIVGGPEGTVEDLVELLLAIAIWETRMVLRKGHPMLKDSGGTAIDVVAADVPELTVSGDGRGPASISFQLDGGANLRVSLTPELLAKLEGMLMQPALEQAEDQPSP